MPFPVLMSIARVGEEYALRLGSGVIIDFRTFKELQTMLPPFGAEE